MRAARAPEGGGWVCVILKLTCAFHDSLAARPLSCTRESMMLPRNLPGSFLLATMLAGCASARSLDEVPIQAPRECESVRRLNARSPGPSYGAARPLERVTACPERAGQAISEALSGLRSSRDPERLEEASWLVHYLHDAQIYGAALDVAGDRRASLEARVNAFRVLHWTLRPSESPGYSYFLQKPVENSSARMTWCSCTGHYYHGYTADDQGWPVIGRLVPEDFVEQIYNLAQRIEMDSAEPQPVRWAASHVRRSQPETELLEKLAEARIPPVTGR